MVRIAVVTGGAGFVGSHLVEALVGKGWRVIVVDDYSAGSEANHVAGAEYRRGCAGDIAHLVPERPSLIFHLGEYARVLSSFRDPAEVWRRTFASTPFLLEWWRAMKVPLIYAGSSTKFASDQEGASLAPYAFAKAAMADLVRLYGKWFQLPWAIAYFYNAYGPREPSGDDGTVVAQFLAARRRGEPLPLRLPGTQRRHFTHVADVVDALLLIADRGIPGEYQIGSDEEFSLRELAELIGGPVTTLPPVPGDRMASRLDVRAVRALGWRPRRNLRAYIQAALGGNMEKEQ